METLKKSNNLSSFWYLASIRGMYENRKFSSYEEAEEFWQKLNENDQRLYEICEFVVRR